MIACACIYQNQTRSQILEVRNNTELKELLKNDEYDFRFDLGVVTEKDPRKLVSAMALHFGILSVKAELDQMLCGLNDTLDALNVIRQHPTLFRPLFVYGSVAPISLNYVYSLFKPKMSDVGSNCRESEEAVLMLWNDFLEKVEGMAKIIIILFPRE